MGKIVGWFSRILGMDDDDQYEEDVSSSDQVSAPIETGKESTARSVQRKKDSAASITTINNVTVMVISPIGFEEARKTVDYIKNQRPVVANFEDTERTLFQRFLDFVSGAVYSMDGRIEKISQYVFLFAPPNVLINAEDKRKFITESASVNKKTFLES